MLPRTMKTVLIASAVAGSLALAGCSSDGGETPGDGSGEADVVSVKIVEFPIPDFAPVWAAEAQGYFTDEQLDVSYDEGGVKTSTDAVPLLVSGTYDLALGAGSSTAQARQQGLPIQIVVGSSQYGHEDGDDNSIAIIARADGPESLADLAAGDVVGVNGLGSATHTYARSAIDQAGADSAALEYQNVPNQTAPELVLNGSVAASTLIEPFLTAALQNPDIKVIGYPSALIATGTPTLSFVASESYIADHADVIDRFRSAVQSGADWLNDPANREEALALIAEHTGLPAELLSNLVLPNYSTAISPELLAQQLDLFVDYGVLEQAPPLDEILATQPE